MIRITIAVFLLITLSHSFLLASEYKKFVSYAEEFGKKYDSYAMEFYRFSIYL